MSKLGKKLIGICTILSSGAIHIRYEDIVRIAYDCGTSFGEVKLRARKMGMYIVPMGGFG